VPFVKELRIDAVELSHADRQIAVRGFDQQMIVIGHEAVSVTNPVISFLDVLEGVQEVFTVMAILEDGFLFVAA
jgi:hypothetical protein